ncbi:1-deoxy-D-xylulose-5-phosphate synthase [Actinosynnema pretiosum subsp. pretiosum]|uniref:1-deoxy-D-xylulose-5-phosphate synthase n=1 Tax=Actinosynnema pretiosum subsp. pretiosum TaxID=103721 RepID=A0AA45L8P0_9PSEU|nr:1-deoxy-D-xylulose 5-phosphate synthase [Actinosynnema pretiosum subsp. pretiosum]QUF04810.1 1-deoxy-D-xylulose-5-phosphate synthase [Actinosynnema pretiosum subsp. pretiosum]
MSDTTTRPPQPAPGGSFDLRALPPDELPGLAHRLRALLVHSVSRTGGHLGPNLGVVELTLALHRVFRSPTDRLVFDTGHQTYVHKMLTGRADLFGGLRRAGGLSGYPSRAESPHDLVENSHTSTALSYADGLARAARSRGEERHVVAVVGDGALTGGMAWEALNSIAVSDLPVVVVLNDNGRSHGPTAGAVGRHLAALRRGTAVSSVFADLGVRYLGPVDGHDIAELEAALTSAREYRGPVVVHCLTRKGFGHAPAEQDESDHMHAIAPPSMPGGPEWTAVLGEHLVALGETRPDLFCLTAAMVEQTGLGPFARRFPDRVLDTGIAEQHAVTCAAGLAMGGLRPVVALSSTFLPRALDQVLMDVALHRLPVALVLGRAGITGEDGPSQHGAWDLALLRGVPGLRVAAPRDATRLRELLEQAVDRDGPTALRFPQGPVGVDLDAVSRVGGVEVLHSASRRDALLVTVGSLAAQGVAAAVGLGGQGIGVTVCDPGWVLPVDPSLIALAAEHRVVVCAEDGVRAGGVGEAVAAALREAGLSRRVRVLGLPSEFLAHGSRSDILRLHGLDAAGIAEGVERFLDRSAA